MLWNMWYFGDSGLWDVVMLLKVLIYMGLSEVMIGVLIGVLIGV